MIQIPPSQMGRRSWRSCLSFHRCRTERLRVKKKGKYRGGGAGGEGMGERGKPIRRRKEKKKELDGQTDRQIYKYIDRQKK